MLGWFKKKFNKNEDTTAPDIEIKSNQDEELGSDESISADLLIPNESPPEPSIVPAPTSDDREEEATPTRKTTPLETAADRVDDPDENEHAVIPPEESTSHAGVSTDTSHQPECNHNIKRNKAKATNKPSLSSTLETSEGEQTATAKESNKDSLFSRLSNKLGKTKESFTYQMDALFLGKKEIDSNLLDSLEEILITADIGVETAEELIDYARKKVKRKELSDPNALKKILKDQIKKYIIASEADATLVMPKTGPFVIMVIGVNGVGKTTTIGKIANKFKQSGQSVMLIAADTFRAAAVSQLQIWGKRNDVTVFSHHEGADPSSVVFDGLATAVSNNVDIVLVDTAGRMHTKDNLMEELKKIKRVMGKKLRGAPHEVMLVIDATTGQNGISQARLFDAAVDITGLTLTKLDGTSKGGIVANICRDMKIPIRFIGIGEQMDDLRDFDASEFVDALFHS